MKRMIVGIGTDLVEVGRIQNALDNSRFLEKCFSAEERELLDAKNDPAPSAANNFAAKEAFSKALGTGVRGFALCEVAVMRDALGKPYIRLSGKAEAAARAHGVERIHVSLTNTEAYASAFVVLEG